jgi:hypothetical protein
VQIHTRIYRYTYLYILRLVCTSYLAHSIYASCKVWLWVCDFFYFFLLACLHPAELKRPHILHVFFCTAHVVGWIFLSVIFSAWGADVDVDDWSNVLDACTGSVLASNITHIYK